MMKYRKKPVVIEALQFTGNFNEIEEFVGGDAEFRDGQLTIATLEGPLHASPNDWIIKGVKGEFYPCKPDIFEATYAKVEGGLPDTRIIDTTGDAKIDTSRRVYLSASKTNRWCYVDNDEELHRDAIQAYKMAGVIK